jgi:hypothetical protein
MKLAAATRTGQVIPGPMTSPTSGPRPAAMTTAAMVTAGAATTAADTAGSGIPGSKAARPAPARDTAKGHAAGLTPHRRMN